jgi:hypothetical protein
VSDLGSLSQCLVDNDPAARVRARRLRGKALVLSVVLEAVVLAAMLVWPLISPGVLIARYIVTPAPPYSGGGAAPHEPTAIHHPHASPLPPICLAVCAPVVRPSTPASTSEAPDIGVNWRPNNRSGTASRRAASRVAGAHERRRNGSAAG